MLQTLIVSVSLAIVVSALCSICEAVLYSLTTSQVEMLRKSGTKAGSTLHDLKSDIDEPITAILTLNTIANTVGAAIAGAAAAHLFGDRNVFFFSAAFTTSSRLAKVSRSVRMCTWAVASCLAATAKAASSSKSPARAAPGGAQSSSVTVSPTFGLACETVFDKLRSICCGTRFAESSSSSD